MLKPKVSVEVHVPGGDNRGMYRILTKVIIGQPGGCEGRGPLAQWRGRLPLEVKRSNSSSRTVDEMSTSYIFSRNSINEGGIWKNVLCHVA